MKSTPFSPASIIRFTAFPPAPPTPITLIEAPVTTFPSSTSSNIAAPPVVCAGPLDQLLDPASEPRGDPTEQTPFHSPRPGIRVKRVHRQTDPGRESGIGNRFRETREPDRHAPPHRHFQNLLRELGHAREEGRASRQDHPRAEEIRRGVLAHLLRGVRE